MLRFSVAQAGLNPPERLNEDHIKEACLEFHVDNFNVRVQGLAFGETVTKCSSYFPASGSEFVVEMQIHKAGLLDISSKA